MAEACDSNEEKKFDIEYVQSFYKNDAFIQQIVDLSQDPECPLNFLESSVSVMMGQIHKLIHEQTS